MIIYDVYGLKSAQLSPTFISASFPGSPNTAHAQIGFPIVSRSLRISGSGCDDALSSGSSSECDEAHTHAPQEFPIEILPNLYLGNSTNSEDCDALARHNIKVIFVK